MDVFTQNLVNQIEVSNVLYICHYCINYTTTNKSDMVKHFNKKSKCIQNNNIDYGIASLLSKEKKYFFTFDYKELTIFDYKFIINNYCNDKNYINYNFKLIKNNDEINQNKKDEINQNKKDEINQNKKDDIKEEKSNIDFFINNEGKYECPKCFTEYLSKQNLEKHFTNFKSCEKKKEKFVILDHHKNIKEEKIRDASTQTINEINKLKDNISKSFSNICIGTDDINYDNLNYTNLYKISLVDIENYFNKREYSYNTSTYNDVEEYNYMLQRAVDVGTNIIKIGMSRDKNGSVKRISKYEKGYKIIAVKVAYDARNIEDKLLKHFNSYFKPRPDIGKEYFEGNLKEMEIAFFTICCKN